MSDAVWGRMSGGRLSALDASFLSMESAAAHMHVGWVATFSAPASRAMPCFEELRDHIGRRLTRAPRYRQKLASVPLGLRAPEWVNDPAFTVDRHVYWAPGPLHELVDEVMSVPLRRDRPLWELWICDGDEPGMCAIVGKLHHCMVDGIAAVELGTLLLDPTPNPVVWKPTALQPKASARSSSSSIEGVLLRALRDLAAEQIGVLAWPVRAARSPLRAARETAGGTLRVARAVGHSVTGAPESVINGPLSPLRSMAWIERPLNDLLAIKRAYGTTLDDVMLASVAGGLREYLMRRGEQPTALKAMVPASVRGATSARDLRASFVFCPLPCEEEDPLSRLYRVHVAMSNRTRNREPEGADLALKAAEHAPGRVQQTLARMLASSHTFNLVVSNIPGPRMPLYLLGCRLEAAYPVLPLADSHALSIGVTSVCDRACFGLYADRETLSDIELLARDIDAAISELLARTRTKPTRSGRGTLVAVPEVPQHAPGVSA